MYNNLDYLYLLISFTFYLFISLLIFFLSFLLNKKDFYKEKVSSYECGFEAFSNSRTTFDVKFYLVSLLFLIFDLEIIFLFPWTVSVKLAGFFGFFVVMLFIFILIIGFLYEWAIGGLDWNI